MTNISTSAFTLKGSMMTLTVMHLNDPTPTAIDKQLSKTIAETPNLFRNMPVVIDLQKVEQHPDPIDFAEISAQLREYGLIPVGVSNGSEAQHQSARMSALGTLSTSNKNSSASKKPATTKPKNAEPFDRPMIIKQPVRSGQQIYAKNADLIIQATVSNGAEVIADGNIHIYGSLRGRAIAGAKGDSSARIFCQSLQAELVSICGNYKLHEQLADVDPSRPVVAWLDEGQVVIEEL